MSDDGSPSEDRRTESERRRRRAKVFGDVLPESTSDDVADNGEDESGKSDEWLRGQKPPHHE